MTSIEASTDRGTPADGTVGRTVAESSAGWAERPSGAGHPNVVVVMCDDLGFADIGCYGSEIRTPTLDGLADQGLRYTNFHVTPMCSSTRAALMTGRNHHAVGFGTVTQMDMGFPGYTMELPDDVVTMAEAFHAAGYGTLAVGKWHLSREDDLHVGGSLASWPLQRGFDRYYGVLDALTNHHHPHRLVEDNHAIDVDTYPDDYYLTDDLTDRAIGLIRELKTANPDKPFLLYLAHLAVHAPLHAKPADMARYQGLYDEGWDAIREARHRAQLELGVIPAGTRLAPRNHEPAHDVGAWAALSADQQRLYARHMEVYAAMVDSVDQNLGRLQAALQAMGLWDDTIVVFTSDNGGSKEGDAFGTTRYMDMLGRRAQDLTASDLERFDLIGGPRTLSHYPRGWAMASNTPFRLYKINTHAGGHQVPFIISWPTGLAARGLRHQYAYVTDLFPTLADLAGIDVVSTRHGQPAQPLHGVSFRATLDDPAAAPARHEQYYEMRGHRGYYRDGWEIVSFHRAGRPFDDDAWELYNLQSDPTELDDLAHEQPELVRELAAAWEVAARDNHVFPLNDAGAGTVRPPWEAAYTRPVTIPAGAPSLERSRSRALIRYRDFDVKVALRYRTGDQGVLVAHGDQGDGYVLYVEAGRLTYVHNRAGDLTAVDAGPVPDGARSITLAVTARPDAAWDLVVGIDGRDVAQIQGLPTHSGFGPLEGIDVGVDRRSPVCWELYERHGAFPWTGEIHEVTYQPGPALADRQERMAADRRHDERYE